MSAHDPASVHATAPQAHSEDASYWPAVLAVALVAGAIAATVLPVAVLGALALAVVGILGVTREVARAHAGRDAPRVTLALALTVPVIVMLITALRAFVEHGLFAADAWPAHARDLNGPAAASATGLALASAAAAAWAARAARRENTRAVGAGLAGALALGSAALVARVVEWARSGLALTDGPAGSAYYALTGVHALAVVSALVVLAIAWWRARREPADVAGGHVTAAAAYAGVLAVAWCLAYAVVYLRIVTIERAPLV